MLKYIAYLAAAGKVDLASVMFSRVGHTHCALGALTAILHSWVGTVLVSIGQFAKTVASSEIRYSDCWQQQCDIVTSFVMSKTSSSPLTLFENLNLIPVVSAWKSITIIQTGCICCSKESPLHASSHRNPQLDRASLPNQSGVHWLCSWLEEMAPCMQRPLLPVPDFFLT